jgi:hypothetical protein
MVCSPHKDQTVNMHVHDSSSKNMNFSVFFKVLKSFLYGWFVKI